MAPHHVNNIFLDYPEVRNGLVDPADDRISSPLSNGGNSTTHVAKFQIRPSCDRSPREQAQRHEAVKAAQGGDRRAKQAALRERPRRCAAKHAEGACAH